MKKYIKASSDVDVSRYLRQAVRNIANYMYNEAPIDDDDPRADYFVENICEDSNVLEAAKNLKDKLEAAYDRQMRY